MGLVTFHPFDILRRSSPLLARWCSRVPDVLVGRHHARRGHGLVEARPTQSHAPWPRSHAHAQLVLASGGGCV